MDILQRSSKLARTTSKEEGEEEYFSSSKTLPFHQGIPLMRSEHMLSFSDKPEESLDFSNKNSFSPLLHQIPSSYFRNSGMMMNMSIMQGKGAFTLTQWAELEEQALIYKYITANVPVPSSLLVSIKKNFYPYGSLPPNSFGWGSFHVGFGGGNMDPEPGRCRRTDGKKWRCSRDAVPDQKYCERHINRGRHRSRKLVEVQSNQQSVKSSNHSSLIIGSQYINPSTDSVPNIRVQHPQELPVKQRNNNNSLEFGHISSDSLLNPSSTKNYGSSSFLDFSSNQEMKSDWTKLSMSIPIASSSPSSNGSGKKGNVWIPMSWRNNSLGGPLGEVLNSRTNSPTLEPSCSLSNGDNGDYFLHSNCN